MEFIVYVMKSERSKHLRGLRAEHRRGLFKRARINAETMRIFIRHKRRREKSKYS